MIQGSQETGANAAVESGHVPSLLLGLMASFRAQIGVELSKDVEEGRHPRSYEDSNENMQTIIDILLDLNQQLVTCLAELENEAEKRTQQMQKRLHSTADVTRETVYKMCEWGEEIQRIVSKRHLAEEAAYESKRMVAELQKENSQLRNYNDNLCSDIQSLLSIINVARTTGNWEMDCVTFCVISPEEVYGPICRLSSQHADGVTTLDLKPDPLLQGPETEETGAATGAPSKVGGKSTSCRTKFFTNTPEVCGEAEAQSKTLLALELQTLLDVSTKEVEFRDKALSNLETKLTNSRQEAGNLKEELLHVKLDLELAKKTAEKERGENERSKAEVEKLSQTVTYLQDALVELKKIKALSSAASLPRVHDV